MGEPLNKTERWLLDVIIAAADDSDVLTAQAAAATATHRSYSGVGFFVTLSVPRTLPESRSAKRQLGSGIFVDVEGVPTGAGTVLFVRDGYLDTLELFTFEGPMPRDMRIIYVTNDPIVPG